MSNLEGTAARSGVGQGCEFVVVINCLFRLPCPACAHSRLACTNIYIVSTVCLRAQGQIYERKEIEKYLEKEGNSAISPVTRKKFESKDLEPLIHVRKAIEHLVESRIIEEEMADTWKRMKEKRDNDLIVKGGKKRAEKGDGHAMYNLGMWLEKGDYGLKVDEKEAYKWYKKGSDDGNVCCMALAGDCLLNGRGTAENVSEGLVLVTMAAERGSDYACYTLGEFYYRGIFGFRKDNEKAKFWLEKAVAEDCEHDHLSDESMEEARDWIAEINSALKT